MSDLFQPTVGEPSKEPYTVERRIRDYLADLRAAGINFANFESIAHAGTIEVPGLDENDRVKTVAAVIDKLIIEGELVAHGDPLNPMPTLFLL